MAINSIATASKYTEALDKMIVQKAVTGFLADNAFRAKFVGAKTVVVPDIDFVGLADYDRDEGYARGKTTIAQTSFTLSKDRGRQIMIDREDLDESGVANLAGNVLSEFVRTKVVPEMDAYTISKLAGIASTKSHATAVSSGDSYFTLLLNAINNVQARGGFDQELVAFVSPDVYSALMSASEITRQLIVTDFKKGDVNVKVQSLNGVAIIPVDAARMYTKYIFATGKGTDSTSITTELSGEGSDDLSATSSFTKVDTTSGGFTPDANAADLLKVLVMPKNGASLVKKTETMRIFTPEQNKDADAYVFDYRLYYDVFVKKSNLDLIESVYDSWA